MTNPERLLSLSEVAALLNMKRSNVAKFLARRGVPHDYVKAQGYLWLESRILEVKAQREADAKRMAADEKRRRTATRTGEASPPSPPPELARIGSTQRALLISMLRRPVVPVNDAERLALRRLRERGLVEAVPGERGVHQLAESARAQVAEL